MKLLLALCLTLLSMLSASSSPVETIKAQLPYAGCGGKVSLTPNATIEYKLNQTYEANEFCIWIFEATFTIGSVEVTIEQDGFDSAGGDGLTGYYLGGNGSTSDVQILTCSFANQTTCLLPSGIAFLAFTSDDSSQGRGFRATISARKGVSDLKYHVTHSAGASGQEAHPFLDPFYANNERRAVIIRDYRLEGKGQTGIEWLSTEDTDYLRFFAIQPFHIDHGRTLNYGRYSGYYPTGYPNSYFESKYPRLALFTSDATGYDLGYIFLWR